VQDVLDDVASTVTLYTVRWMSWQAPVHSVLNDVAAATRYALPGRAVWVLKARVMSGMRCFSSIWSNAALMLVHPLRQGLAFTTALHIVIVTRCNPAGSSTRTVRQSDCHKSPALLD